MTVLIIGHNNKKIRENGCTAVFGSIFTKVITFVTSGLFHWMTKYFLDGVFP